MAGIEREDIGEAGEYVLGTLDAAERAAFESRLALDASLQAEVAAWQRRLAPLDDEVREEEPPSHLLTRIFARIDAPVASNILQLKRRVNAWRGATVIFAAAAAALLVVLTMRGIWQPAPQKGLYVAVLQGRDATPAFVAAVDMKSKEMVVRRVGAASPAGHSYELWALGGGRAAPQPLGVIEASMRLPAGQLGDRPIAATMLAVSLEPAGGSPTGLPTGPVLFTGKLISAE